MDSLPKGIGDPSAERMTFQAAKQGPTWTHCRKALVTHEPLRDPLLEGGGSDMDSLPKGIGDKLMEYSL